MDRFDWLLKKNEELVLKGAVLSNNWIDIYELAPPLDHFDMYEITALIEMPCGLGTLVLEDIGFTTTPDSPWELIEKWLKIHRFSGVQLQTGALGTVSLAFPTFCLTAIPDSHSVLWINPLRIYQLYYRNEGVLVELMNEFHLNIAIDCQHFLCSVIETVNPAGLKRAKWLFPDSTFDVYLEEQVALMEDMMRVQTESDLLKKLLVSPRLLEKEMFSLRLAENLFLPSPCVTTA